MKTKFTGDQVYSLLKQRAEDTAYNKWGKGTRDLFAAYVWLKSEWTKFLLSGYLEGALTLVDIQNMEDDNSAEFQCLQHHFCLLEESCQST